MATELPGNQQDITERESIDAPISFSDLVAKLSRGLHQILGLSAIGAAIAALVFLIFSPVIPETTTTRVVFSFAGYERGEYPDHSKFQADDLRSPEIIARALERQSISNVDGLQGKIRSAISIEGIIPASVTKERDRLRAAGQTPPLYVPDEYTLSLTLSRKFPLDSRRRELLLREIINLYIDQFQRTYAQLPNSFGEAFDSLKDADFFEYELVLGQEIQKITNFLSQLATEENQQGTQNQSRAFRSPNTNLSFGDLLSQTQLFAQLRVNETLGLIYLNGLTRDRKIAMTKLDYYLRTLEDRENSALQEENVVRELLKQTQDRANNYVLGIKSQTETTKSGQSPLIDKGLVDSLLENDSTNFLVRRALDAGLNVRRIQSEKAIVTERRHLMEQFVKNGQENNMEAIRSVDRSLLDLKKSYDQLIDNIRKTHKDFAHQEYGDAIRITAAIQTESSLKMIAIFSVIGLLIGFSLGIGLSLLGVYITEKPLRLRSRLSA